jgi:hypothetical protein
MLRERQLVSGITEGMAKKYGYKPGMASPKNKIFEAYAEALAIDTKVMEERRNCVPKTVPTEGEAKNGLATFQKKPEGSPCVGCGGFHKSHLEVKACLVRTIHDLRSKLARAALSRHNVDGGIQPSEMLKAIESYGVVRDSSVVPMLLWCPACSARHVDVGEFATKVHHTHACQSCGVVWRPAIVPTVGVQYLPGFKDSAT